MNRRPYLIQRLEKAAYAKGKSGVDLHFSCDYMGSAEFEFGSLPASLKEMRGRLVNNGARWLAGDIAVAEKLQQITAALTGASTEEVKPK